MDNQQLRSLKERLGMGDYQLNYKTGVRLGVIEDFFSGRLDEPSPKDRQRIEEALMQAARKRVTKTARES